MPNPPITHATPATDVPGTVRQALAGVTKISEALDSGTVPDLVMSATLATLADELRGAAAVMAGVSDDGESSVRGFLAALVEALSIPAPATADDQRAYERTRSLRADECVRAARNIMSSASDPTAKNWRWAAAWLRTAASDHEITGYRHAGPGAGFVA